MNKKYAIIGGVALVVIGGLWMASTQIAQAPIGEKACTTDAKLCPDGSAVGRTGPNCEFTPCLEQTATTTTTTTTSGTVSIGKKSTINGSVITVRSLVEDSRCPADVQCIQAGTVRVSAVIDAYRNNFTFTLGQPQVVGNKTITLTSVTPTQKTAQKPPQLSEYRFTFSVVLKAVTTPGGTACTMEAKICLDGSAVGRTGSNCEFTPCPTTIAPYKSGVSGTVLLGPTCPVERIPPDPQCAEKPYATAITVTRTGSTAPFVIGSSDTSGVFRFSLPPGSYTLAASGGTMLPRCSSIDVTVGASGYVTTTISCDTGIR